MNKAERNHLTFAVHSFRQLPNIMQGIVNEVNEEQYLAFMRDLNISMNTVQYHLNEIVGMNLDKLNEDLKEMEKKL